MHTSRSMRPHEFKVTADGKPGTLDDVLPGLTTADRLAIVTHTPGGSLAAAPLLLAAVGRYYELLRTERDEFYRYPGYFVVHVGELRAYHGWLDVWAEHKEVVVDANAEAVLDALHDRGITRVLLEDVEPARGELMRETANWFIEDIQDVLSFTPGHSEGALTVRPSAAASRLVRLAVQASHGVIPPETGATVQAGADRPQAFERLTPLAGLQLMCGYGPTPHVIGQSDEYVARHGATLETMGRHLFAVEAPGR
ncbi:hypothetical protein ACIBL3_41230 [Kribbella sp. NPDC050124]|uniref:hypothetical protein n=1 Tax=Kribbella sp. NPDC050124 TaxID=3364114 RepID=UPI0037BCE673